MAREQYLKFINADVRHSVTNFESVDAVVIESGALVILDEDGDNQVLNGNFSIDEFSETTRITQSALIQSLNGNEVSRLR